MAMTACWLLELFLLRLAAASFLSRVSLDGFVLDSRLRGLMGCMVESESVSPLGIGDGESRPSFSFRARLVFGLSLVGLAMDSAYLPVPSMMFPDSSASSTLATLWNGCFPDIARRI